MIEKIGIAVGFVFVSTCVMLLVAVLLGIPTMMLWNWLMPPIFGLTKIGFLQALGMILLSGILFKTTASVKGK